MVLISDVGRGRVAFLFKGNQRRGQNKKQLRKFQANLVSLKATESKSLIADSLQANEENSNTRDKEEVKQEDELADMNVDREQSRVHQLKLTE